MKVSSVLLVVALMSASNSWAAGVYRYVDKDGNVTFKDEYKPGAYRLPRNNELRVPEVYIAIEAAEASKLSKPLHTPKIINKRKATTAEMNKCFEQHRNSFIDPRSVYPVEATFRVVENQRPVTGGKSWFESIVEVDVSGRNELGAPAREKVSCNNLMVSPP